MLLLSFPLNIKTACVIDIHPPFLLVDAKSVVKCSSKYIVYRIVRTFIPPLTCAFPKGIKLNILAENSQFQEENDPNEERDFDKQPTTMPYKADAKLISPHFKFLFEISIAIGRLRNQMSSCCIFVFITFSWRQKIMN